MSTNAEPYLVYGGIEIGNIARTAEYIKAAPKNCCRHNVSFCNPCPSTTYDPCLNNGAGGYETYASPAADPAPWYSSASPESAEFLGLIISQLQVRQSTRRRGVTERSHGAGFGRQRRGGREIEVEGRMYAISCCGMDYGMAWLERSLGVSEFNPCTTCDAEIVTCCSDDPMDKRFTMCDVAITEGPEFESEDRACECCPACCAVDFRFTLVAGNPYLLGCPETCAYQVDLGGLPFCGSTTAELEVTKSASDSTPEPGQCITYTVFVQNVSTGSSATNVVFSDALTDPDLNLTIGTVTTTQGTITSGNTGGDVAVGVNIGSIGPGQTHTVTYEACVAIGAANTTITNTAIATSNNSPSVSDTEVVSTGNAPCSCSGWTSDLPSPPCTLTSASQVYQVFPGANCDASEWNPSQIVWSVDGVAFGFGAAVLLDATNYSPGNHTISVTVSGANGSPCENQTLFTDSATCDFQPPTCACLPTVNFPAPPCSQSGDQTFAVTIPAGCVGNEYSTPEWFLNGSSVGTGFSVLFPDGWTGTRTYRVVVNGIGPCAGQVLLDESVTCTRAATGCGGCAVTVTPPLVPPCNINSVTVYQVSVAGCAPTEWANPQWYVDGNLVGTGTFFVLDPNAYSSGIHSIRLLIDGEGACTGQVIYDETVQCTFPALAPARLADDEDKTCDNIVKWLDRRGMTEADFFDAIAERTDQFAFTSVDDLCEEVPEGFADVAADVFGVKPSSVTGRRS